MIEEITFDLSEKFSDYYGNNLPSLHRLGGRIQFKKGLNIILGPNGSGKSTILKAISQYLAAEHTGVSIVTDSWIRDLRWEDTILSGKEAQTIKSPYTVSHDGQPIVFGDPRRAMGLSRGYIDDNMYSQGVIEQLESSTESMGEQCNRRLIPFIEYLLNPDDSLPKEISVQQELLNSNTLYANRTRAALDQNLKATIPLGQRTVLLDEPEAALSIPAQIILWKKVLSRPDVSENYQLIIASNNMACLGIEGANYIELKGGFFEACNKAAQDELSLEDLGYFAANIQTKLSTAEEKMLQRSSSENLDYDYRKAPNSLKKLESIDFVRSFSLRRSRFKELAKDNMNRTEKIRLQKRCDNLYRYQITEKGLQYLNILKN
ncbi:AAA family ATPase [Vibrio sp. D431a]|uniref:AAA family ATPase n=1 Tax=Vibrio sp. D431a TaxID=2837388 RepID=UPI002554229C|nr:AAA family ATPase [Vibrio sp. D431a]MDK9789837.1 AAA family ATPase [Vibrio sp. D431a]